MKVLITGGAGYIGTELTYYLDRLSEVEEIVIYDNLSRGNHNLFIGQQKISDKVRFVQGELLDSRTLRSLVKDKDVVYHLAAKVATPFADQNPHFFEQTNHWGTAELVYAVEEESQVSKFIYVSSVSVLGASAEELTVHSHPNPKTFYGISKLRGEEHVQRLAGKVPTQIVRCGNVYGYSKSMRFDAVINKFMFDANFAGRLKINGNGEQHRSFVHIDHVATALGNLPVRELPTGFHHLVDRVMSINEIAEELRELYPELETLFVNQHLSLREVKVQPTKELMALAESKEESFREELEAFRKAFTF